MLDAAYNIIKFNLSCADSIFIPFSSFDLNSCQVSSEYLLSFENIIITDFI